MEEGERGTLIYAGRYRAMKATYGRSTFVGATHTEFDKAINYSNPGTIYYPLTPSSSSLIASSSVERISWMSIISYLRMIWKIKWDIRILNGSDELIVWWRVASIKVYSVEEYRKIKKIRPRAYIFQRPFFEGLILEGLLFGEAYLWREIDWASPIVKRKFTVFALFYFVFEGNFQVQAPGGLIFGDAI